MPAKKLNLSPDVKNRLRQAVLGGISPAIAPSVAASAKPVSRAPATNPDRAKPAPKTLKPIILNKPDTKHMPEPKLKVASKPKPKAVKSKKTIAEKKTAVSAKVPARPAVARTQKAAPAFVAVQPKPKSSGYKPFAAAKRDWEISEPEESLESLFKGNPKQKSASKAESAFKFSSEPKQSKPKRHLGWKIAGVVVLLAVLVIGFVVLGIYKYGFNDAFSNQTAKILSLPAGSVDNISISASEYQDNLQALSQSMSANREGLIDYSGKEAVTDKIFYRLAANSLVAEKLQAYGRQVTQQDIDNQLAILLKQTGGQAQAEKIIQNLYGLSFDQFKGLVLIPMMQRSNLQAAIVNDDSLAITRAAQDRANEALKLALASSTDFNVLAKQYTDDESSVNTGGDLGWVVKGQLDQSWESVIFSAATGTVIKQPIKSGFGFHIVKVEQKLVDKATGAVSVKLRHILIKVDVDQYIKELLEAAKVVRYIK